MDNIEYIHIGFFTKLYNQNYNFDQEISIEIKKYLSKQLSEVNNTIFFIDFDNINLIPIQDKEKDLPKKTPIYLAFHEIIGQAEKSQFVFINCEKYTREYIIKKDFERSENVLVINSKLDSFIILPESKSFLIREQIPFIRNILSLPKSFKFTSNESIITLRDKLISNSIKKMLLNNKQDCIVHTTKENHILQSTPVHVNKYINIKPLIEDHASLSYISYLISENISSKMNIPDFIVASSKNSFALSSCISFFLNCDIIIINQVSPITSFNNFSTLDKIEPNSRYAIIEDFFCMGSETNIVKGILWSKGVNVYENVYVFPVASTKLLDNDKTPMSDQKIFPLYKIDEEIQYKVFTYNTCPVCNDISCHHRKLFNF